MRTAWNKGMKFPKLSKENASNYIHGMTKTRLYWIWGNMKNRCLNPNNPHYKNYGIRNVKICEEWIDFNNFKEWALSNGYEETLTLDRENVNGDYCPDNCRFVTMKKQQNNRTNNHIVEYNDDSHTIAEWSDITGIKYDTIERRINYHHWSIGEALGFEERIINRSYNTKKIICNENNIEYNSLTEASNSLNIPMKQISKVLNGNQKSTRGLSFKYI